MIKNPTKQNSDSLALFSDQLHWVLLAGVLFVFTMVLYPNLNPPSPFYHLGDVAERDIKAKKEFFIEDKNATHALRQEAMEKTLTFYDYDPTLFFQIKARVESAFADMREEIRKEKELQSQASPPLNVISSAVQPDHSNNDSNLEQTLSERLWKKKKEFETSLAFPINKGAFQLLVKESFSERIPKYILSIVAQLMQNGIVANKEILLKESEKGIILRDVKTQNEQNVLNLKKYYGPNQAKAMVRIIGDPLLKDLPYELTSLIVDFSQQLIQPNISLNRNETETRKQKAAEKINPVLHIMKAGEMVLREGERVTEVQQLKLKAMANQVKKSEFFSNLIGSVVLLFVTIVIIYHLHLKHQGPIKSYPQKNLLFLATMSVSLMMMVKFSAMLSESWELDTVFLIPREAFIYSIPLAAGAMTVCLFLGLDIAIAFAMLMAMIAAFLLKNHFEAFIYFLLNGITGAYWVRKSGQRKDVIIAGAKIGILNIVVATAISIYLFEVSGPQILWMATFAFISGVVTSILTIGTAPIVEVAFCYTTHITLMELANLDRPILRRLMIEAPGTYHHSVIVGTLVEVAASEIGANPILAKVCGYYHDIGKINKPYYFIENQSDGINRHDKLAPSMSSLILTAHVKEGVEFAKKHKLGQAIIDAIEQHHGTSKISYFFEKAKQLKGADQVNVENYRYPGPKPQTKEAGLVMLADVVEAASRTLDNPTPSRIQGLVQTLINKIFSDGQLDSCELTLKDLHNIAKSFNKILNGIHHHRIEYADSLNPTASKEKNVSTDKQPSKQARDQSRKSDEKSKSHLKRLGLS